MDIKTLSDMFYRLMDTFTALWNTLNTTTLSDVIYIESSSEVLNVIFGTLSELLQHITIGGAVLGDLLLIEFFLYSGLGIILAVNILKFFSTIFK